MAICIGIGCLGENICAGGHNVTLFVLETMVSLSGQGENATLGLHRML